jgi:hypothetical protein
MPRVTTQVARKDYPASDIKKGGTRFLLTEETANRFARRLAQVCVFFALIGGPVFAWFGLVFYTVIGLFIYFSQEKTPVLRLRRSNRPKGPRQPAMDRGSDRGQVGSVRRADHPRPYG